MITITVAVISPYCWKRRGKTTIPHPIIADADENIVVNDDWFLLFSWDCKSVSFMDCLGFKG